MERKVYTPHPDVDVEPPKTGTESLSRRAFLVGAGTAALECAYLATQESAQAHDVTRRIEAAIDVERFDMIYLFHHYDRSAVPDWDVLMYCNWNRNLAMFLMEVKTTYNGDVRQLPIYNEQTRLFEAYWYDDGCTVIDEDDALRKIESHHFDELHSKRNLVEEHEHLRVNRITRNFIDHRMSPRMCEKLQPASHGK